MNNFRMPALASLLVLALAAAAAADVVVLWDETTYTGRVTRVDRDRVTIDEKGREVRIPREQVAAIQFAAAGASGTTGTAAAPAESELPDEDTGTQTYFGNTGRHRGWLVGTAYEIDDGTDAMPDWAAAEELPTRLYAQTLNVAPRRIYSLSPVTYRKEWFGIIYEGVVEVTATDSYTIELTSDDGSMLYWDGELLIDNSGKHGPQARSAAVRPRVGRHRLRIEYFQASGSDVALLLKVARGSNPLQLWDVTKPLGGGTASGSGWLF